MLLILNYKMKLSEIKKARHIRKCNIPVTRRHYCSWTFSRNWSRFNYQNFHWLWRKGRNETVINFGMLMILNTV
jgi:hypothetical protein